MPKFLAGTTMTSAISNAVIVKIRSRYAKRFKDADFNSLVNCSSVSEIASKLKNNQLFSKVISDIKDKEIRRENLESALNYAFLEDLSIIAKYDLSFEKKIFRYVISKFEVRQICKFLLFLKSNTVSNFKSFFPSFFKFRSKIKFDEFNSAENFNDLLSAVRQTDYYNILSKYASDFDINKIEASLYNYIFDLLYSSISKFNFRVRSQSVKFLYNYMNVSNVIRSIRSKKFYNASDEYIENLLFKIDGYKFSMDDVLEFNNFSKFSFIDDGVKSIEDLEKFSKVMRFKWAQKNIRYSNIAEIVGFSYILLKEIEISNLINIIEGVRYNLSRNIIKTMIIR